MTDDQWYDLFESVAANLRHGNLTRKQQHEELARIVAAERERFIDALADACVAAEIPDSKYESLLLTLKA